MKSGNGLDFGTSTIFVASPDGVVPIGESWTWMPSLVGAVDDGSVIVGEDALEVDDSQVVRSVKRFITESRGFVQLDTPTGLRDVRVDDLMVEMLRETAKRAGERGVDLRAGATMMGCPAMWDGQQRRRLHELAVKAGLKVGLADLVDEPVAAGIAWLSAQKAASRQRVLVFDMGGGTLDIAVLDVEADEVSVLAAMGIAEAGNALDVAVADDLEYLLAAQGINLRTLERPKRARARLHYAAQDAKISLSSVTRIDVKLPRREFGVASIPYSRDQLNEVFAPQMDRAELCVETALRVAHLLSSGGTVEELAEIEVDELTGKVDVVVLSGGMSQIPYVTQRLRGMFPDRTRIELACSPADSAVAVGLAKAAGYGHIVSRYRPAFDVVLEWKGGKKTVYEAFTPLLEMRQLASHDELRFVRTGRQLKLPEDGTGTLRVISHAGEEIRATVNGSNLDGFKVALCDFEFSLYPNGRIRVSDERGDYEGHLDGWQERKPRSPARSRK